MICNLLNQICVAVDQDPAFDLEGKDESEVQEIEEGVSADVHKLLLSKITAKWSASVVRLTGVDFCDGYHAISYTDMPALHPILFGEDAANCKHMSSFMKLSDALKEDGRNASVWKLLSEISSHLKEKFEHPVHVPTVKELAEDIAKHKLEKKQDKEQKQKHQKHQKQQKQQKQGGEEAATDSAPSQAGLPKIVPEIKDTSASITKAVHQVFTQLCKSVAANTKGGKKFLEYTSTFEGDFVLQKMKEINEKYNEFETAVETGDVSYLVDEVDWSILFSDAKRCSYFTSKLEACDDDTFKSIQTHLNHLVSFTIVKEHIPQGMMKNIESYTSGLLVQLKNKEIDFSDLDIEKIGKEVVESSNQDDVESMGSRINELFPIIQKSDLFSKVMNMKK